MRQKDDKNSGNGKIIHIKRISIDSKHIRRNITDIKGLKDTIADAGLLQPILVRQTESGYRVIDGARRLQALKELEVQELIIGRDVIVDESETEADETFKQLIANVQREDINDIELGHAFVTLKEKYGYAYKDMAEIIGKTPHYVAAKVGMAKRLNPEVQEIVIKDWEAARCTRNTLKCDSDDALDPYVMNVNVIEDIARLPAELQKAAYELIHEKEMDKKEALRHLKSIKQDAEVLKLADDARGLIQNYADEGNNHDSKDVKKYFNKIDRDVGQLLESLKSSSLVDREQLAPALESLIERLNMLYSEIKAGKDDYKALATGK